MPEKPIAGNDPVYPRSVTVSADRPPKSDDRSCNRAGKLYYFPSFHAPLTGHSSEWKDGFETDGGSTHCART